MLGSRSGSIEIRGAADFEKAQRFINEFLRGNQIPQSVVSETMLIFEALFYEIFSQKKDAEKPVTISGQERLGYVSIRFTFEGGIYIQENRETDPDAPEEKILLAYSDKIDYSYQFGFNRVRIVIRYSHAKALLPYAAAVLLGFAVFFLLNALGTGTMGKKLLSNLILPLEILFGNAMLMIGAPVTFFSLLKNLTDTYIVSERSSYGRMVRRTIIRSSVISVLLAAAASLLTAWIVSRVSPSAAYTNLKIDITIPEFIESLLPSDIFAPFQMVSPFPLIFVAGIITYALCSVGKHFDRLKKAVDAGYALFSRILSIIMTALPFFTFLAVLNLLMVDGRAAVYHMAELTAAVALSLPFMAAFYWIRLKKSGIRVLKFVKKLGPLLTENYMIGSALEAVPFNIRYCSRELGIERKKLMISIPLLAQINLDGNCFIITYISLILLLASRTRADWVDIVLVALLVLFLSLGAPNQPGSCLIGILIILTYMEAQKMIPLAIFSEVVFGSLLNLINITGDIVTAAECGRKKSKSCAKQDSDA